MVVIQFAGGDPMQQHFGVTTGGGEQHHFHRQRVILDMGIMIADVDNPQIIALIGAGAAGIGGNRRVAGVYARAGDTLPAFRLRQIIIAPRTGDEEGIEEDVMVDVAGVAVGVGGNYHSCPLRGIVKIAVLVVEEITVCY